MLGQGLVCDAAPTAQQFAALVQATALRTFCVGLGFGVVTIDQSLPFHSSASVCMVPPLPVDASPTAQQSEAPAQVTPIRRLFLAATPREEALGVVTMDQLMPFHCSAKVEV